MLGQEASRYVQNELGCPMDVLGRFPKYFLIETINYCNANCVMCGIDFSKKMKQTISDSLFAKIVDEISKHNDHVEKVMLYLDCEPLLDKGLPERIGQMKVGISNVNIATNASLLNKDRGCAIIEAGLDEIYITIDSLHKETYEAIRRGLCFEKVYNNIRKFIQLRDQLNPQLLIRIQMVLQDTNASERDFFLAHWLPLLNDRDQVVVVKAHNWASRVEVKCFGDESSINEIPCIALWGTFCVHVNGDVGLCCMDSSSQVLLGNLNDQTIEEIWTGETINNIRQKHLAGERHNVDLCDGCTLWRAGKKEAKRIVGIT